MVRRTDPEPIDRDERLGEAIEVYLGLSEAGETPDLEVFAARYPDLGDDLRAALEGLALVRGLVGESGGPGHRLETGRRIAGYRIVRELGRGGMGIVYEAMHVGLDRPVALKVLGSHAAPDSSGRRRFLNEARTAAGLHHTHIVPVFDVGQVGGLCYYAMQRIEGSGLDRVLRHLRRDRSTAAGTTQNSGGPAAAPTAPHPGREETVSWAGRGAGLDASALAGDRSLLSKAGPEPDDEPTPFVPPRGSAYFRWVAEVGREAAEALAHAHQRGIIHRDVKPSNLLVDARGIVWVADFGLARRLADASQTQHDSLLGTPRYMSPEQARIGPIDGRSDVYSLGATLYELLTLRPPFEGRTAAELIEQIRTTEPASPRQYEPRLPRDLETIVLKALAKRVDDRYATATELAEDLERYLRHEPVRARRISPLGRAWRFVRRHPRGTIGATAAAVAILATATVAHVRVLHERDKATAANTRLEAETRKTEAALRSQLWREASVVRLSNVPNRRSTGLGLLREAAALKPEPALKTKLRNEAVSFLVLRDVEARPEFATGRARGLVFNSDGNRLATLSDDGGEFALWDVETRSALDRHRLRPVSATPTEPAATKGAGPDRPVPKAGGGRRRGGGLPALAAAGPCLAAILPSGQGVRIFDASRGAPIRDLAMPGRRLLGLWATAGGQRLVTVESAPGELPDHSVLTVNLNDPDRIDPPFCTLLRIETGPAGPGRDMPLVALAPDGRTIATGVSRKPAVALWSAEDGHSLGTLETQADLSALALGPDGLLATAGGGSVRFWETETKTPLPGLDTHQGFIRLLRFNPDATLLAVAGMGSNVELWDPASHAVVAVLPTSDRVDDLAFAPDGRTLAAAGGAGGTAVWAVVDPLARFELRGFDAPTSALTFRADGLLALGSWRGDVRFWRPGQCAGGSPPHLAAGASATPPPSTNESEPEPRDKSLSLAFDDRGRLLAVDPELVRLWNDPPKTRRLTPIALPEVRGWWWKMFPPPLARADDGRLIFLGRGPELLAWASDDPERWRKLTMPALPAPPPHDGDRPRPDRDRDAERPRPDREREPLVWRTLAAGPGGDRLYLLDQMGNLVALDRHGDDLTLAWTRRGGVGCLAVSPDGATVAIGERRGGAILLDAAHGTVRGRLPLETSDEPEGRVGALAYAGAGRLLAVGSRQGAVELWSLDDLAQPALRLTGHHGFVNTLAFDPRGRYLASGGPDRLIEIWDVDRIRAELSRLGLAW